MRGGGEVIFCLLFLDVFFFRGVSYIIRLGGLMFSVGLDFDGERV